MEAGAVGALRDPDALDLRLRRDRPRKRDLQPDLRPVPDAASNSSSAEPGVEEARGDRTERRASGPGPSPAAVPAQPRRARLPRPLRPDRRSSCWRRRCGRTTSPHTGPNEKHTIEQITVDGEKQDVVSVEGKPIGPQWFGAGGKFFLGADSRLGRDEMVRLMYGGRTSLLIGIVAALITTLLAVVLGLLAGYFRGWVDAVIARTLDVIWSLPVLLLGLALGDRAGRRRAQARPARNLRRLDLDPDPRHQHLHRALHRAADPRRGARPAREGVRRGRGRPGRGPAAGDVRRDPAQPRLDDHRLLHPDHRQQHAARGGALLPRRRRAAAQLLLGDDDLRRRRAAQHRSRCWRSSPA